MYILTSKINKHDTCDKQFLHRNIKLPEALTWSQYFFAMNLYMFKVITYDYERYS